MLIIYGNIVLSEIEMMLHKCTKLIFPSFNQNVEYTVSLTKLDVPSQVDHGKVGAGDNSKIFLWRKVLRFHQF